MKGNPCMARCYFVGANPLNNYNTDYSNLTVKFQGGLGYKRDEGCSSEIAVFCEGQTPMEGVPQVRIIILEFFEGKWWVKIVTKILISPIEPFYISEEVTPDLSVPDEEDIEREQGTFPTACRSLAILSLWLQYAKLARTTLRLLRPPQPLHIQACKQNPAPH